MSDFSPRNMPTLGDEPPRPVPPRPGAPPPYGRPPQRGSSPAWLLVAVTLGFTLPVCACAFLGFISLASLSALTAGLEDFEAAPETGEEGIGVIALEGVIFQGEGPGAGTERLLQDIAWMEDNGDVEAIVVIANSPGGDANASDVIWNRLAEVEKPVYVAMNGLCASGCYYIAMAADPDQVYATPNSLVGSIGVISTFFNVEELLDDIGVEITSITTGESKDFGSLYREMTPEEEAFWREQINATYENFITVVAGGRANDLTESEIRELADGRVWAASNARDLGLIDGLMYPEQVMDMAASNAGLGSSYRVIESPYLDFDFFGLLSNPGVSVENPLELPEAGDLMDSMQQGAVQYRYFGPYSGATDNE